ncbi:hypothetical protein OHS03_23390 [Nocardia salmonicida]|nr:hypothetical protein [Nocardia salmonicida]
MTSSETRAGGRVAQGPRGHLRCPAQAQRDLSAPIAKRAPFERVHHGDMFVDDYEWLRDKEDPEVIAYLASS